MFRFIADAAQYFFYRSNRSGSSSGSKVNIFEGFRRIAKIIAIVWVLAFAIAGYIAEPYTRNYYLIEAPGIQAVKMGADSFCPPESVQETFDRTTNSGKSISITLCFKSFLENNRQLIPFKRDEKTQEVWMNAPYADEVTAYKERVVKNFKIPEADQSALTSGYWSELIKKWAEGFFMMAGGLVAFWIFCWCVGYIVRGFLGVPQGRDSRLEEPPNA
jgi:hypothetical protein